MAHDPCTMHVGSSVSEGKESLLKFPEVSFLGFTKVFT